ncbi:MAG: hypothetical protein JO136_19785 [Hyphomicrobiales bacterium]|nr:hypothetical protein [Hyphomicrobiales bacterium]
MKRTILLSALAILLAAPAMAKDTQFWNLTSSTVKSLELAPAGASTFGPNQTTNDPDGAVDHDERLKIKGVATGAYDARLKLADGRQCTVKGVRIETGKVFAIEEKDLTGCSR